MLEGASKIPKGWRSVLVSDICRLQNGHGFKPHEWATHGLPIIRIQNLNGSSRYNYYAGDPQEAWLVATDQLLFAWAGTKGVSFGPTVWKGQTAVLNQHIFKVFAAPEVDNGWLFHCLRHVTDRIERRAHGFKSTLVHVKKSEIDNQPVLLPPIEEQAYIAKVLSTWDRAIETTAELIDRSKQQRKELSRRLLTGTTRLLGFSGTWRAMPISALSDRITRRNDGSGLPILTISSTKGFVRQDEKYSRYMAGKSADDYIALRAGEFAYNKGNSKTYEFGCVFPLKQYPEALVPHVYVCFSLNSELYAPFYQQLFEADYLRPQLKRIVKTGVRNNGLLNITPAEFLETTVPVPELQEQKAIAEVLIAASQTIETLSANLDKLKAEKAALMQQLLTGKLRVSTEKDAS